VGADFLEKQKVRPWADMPVWIPAGGEYAGFGRRSNALAIAKGLTFRPLADTAQATLDWYHTRPAEEQAKLRSGLSTEREREVLAAWHASQKKT
jgi:2'-hydroxyisoflavone reductase